MPPLVRRPPAIVAAASRSPEESRPAPSSRADAPRGPRGAAGRTPFWTLLCAPVRVGAASAPPAKGLPPVSARLAGLRPSTSVEAVVEAPTSTVSPVDQAVAWFEKRLPLSLPRQLAFEFRKVRVHVSDRVEGSTPLREVRFITEVRPPTDDEALLTELLRRVLPRARKVDSGHASTVLFMGPIPTGSLTAPVQLPKIGS